MNDATRPGVTYAHDARQTHPPLSPPPPGRCAAPRGRRRHRRSLVLAHLQIKQEVIMRKLRRVGKRFKNITSARAATKEGRT